MKAAWLTEIAIASTHCTAAQLPIIQLLETWQIFAKSSIPDSSQRPPGGIASFRIQGRQRLADSPARGLHGACRGPGNGMKS